MNIADSMIVPSRFLPCPHDMEVQEGLPVGFIIGMQISPHLGRIEQEETEATERRRLQPRMNIHPPQCRYGGRADAHGFFKKAPSTPPSPPATARPRRSAAKTGKHQYPEKFQAPNRKEQITIAIRIKIMGRVHGFYGRI